MTQAFTLSRQVEFNHCDPAGIVFYPRYFEMISSTVERFFADAIGHSWQDMLLNDMGTPTGSIDVRFRAPSRLGDWIDITLNVSRIGTSSAVLQFECTGAGETRFTGSITIVHANTTTATSAPWPESTRQKMAAYLSPSNT